MKTFLSFLFFSVELFNALYRRVLCRNRLNDDQLTVLSLQALAKVYKRYHEQIGKFSDMTYIVQLLDRVGQISPKAITVANVNIFLFLVFGTLFTRRSPRLDKMFGFE